MSHARRVFLYEGKKTAQRIILNDYSIKLDRNEAADQELTNQLNRSVEKTLAEELKTIDVSANYAQMIKDDQVVRVVCVTLSNIDNASFEAPEDKEFRKKLTYGDRPAFLRIEVERVGRSALQKEIPGLSDDDADIIKRQIILVFYDKPAVAATTMPEQKQTPVDLYGQSYTYVDNPDARPMDLSTNANSDWFFAARTVRKSKRRQPAASIVELKLSEAEHAQLDTLRIALCLPRTTSRAQLAALLIAARLQANVRDAVFVQFLGEFNYTDEIKQLVAPKGAISAAELALCARILAAVAPSQRLLKLSGEVGQVLVFTSKADQLTATIGLLDRYWKERLQATYSQQDALFNLREAFLKSKKQHTLRWIRCVMRSIVQNVQVGAAV